MSKLAPWRGQTTTPSSGSQSPSQSGPSSCEQRSSIAYSSPPRLYTQTASPPDRTIFARPGGSSSTGHTSISATLFQLELVEAVPAVRERRALAAMERDTKRGQPEQRALEPHRGQRDAELVEQFLAGHRRHLHRRLPLDDLGQHRRSRLADRAPAAGELDLVDRLAVLLERDVDRDLVAAERVLAL